MQRHSRRTVLATLGSGLTVGLAGCGSDGGDNDSDGGDGDGDGDDGSNGNTTDGADGSTPASPTAIPGESAVPAGIDSFLETANGYDGTIVDATGQSEVTVAVGGDGDLAFDPVAVRVDVNTTINWTWEGGTHNVASTDESDSDFDSGDPTDDTETTFSQSFDNAGLQYYVCEVHESGGMLGAIDVV